MSHISTETRWRGYHKARSCHPPPPKNTHPAPPPPPPPTHPPTPLWSSLLYASRGFCYYRLPFCAGAREKTQHVDRIVTVLRAILRRPRGSLRSISTLDSAFVHKVLLPTAPVTRHKASETNTLQHKNTKPDTKPLKIKSSVSKSNPSLWHFLHSPVTVELKCRLQRDSIAGAGGKKCRLARSSISPLTLEPFLSTFFSFGSIRSGRLLLEM